MGVVTQCLENTKLECTAENDTLFKNIDGLEGGRDSLDSVGLYNM